MTSKKRLSESQITTRPMRREVLGLMGGGVLGLGLSGPARAQESDADNGTWEDVADCPRGPGGVYSGVTDADDGAITDTGGYGRGEPLC